ncbi:unnamed protein product [Zymoseptoria tritici ST99CH_3D7]|uniref:Glycoside hydrolase family 92 protein n=1 Tax=Zymoseptoria tritici (strain ST99CH_3D7) TaxID=1276538 RepID=A0A1X7S593_ZYMT9|nr:unnamed protein product [Zymoseptoria tritici ST99CH_3D7]
MASFQTYKLLENGQDPGADPEQDDFDIDPKYSKPRRKFLESVQSVKSFLQYVNERSPVRIPRCGVRQYCFGLAAGLAVVIVVAVVGSALFGVGEGEDVLQYIDPLIGTGPGGHVFAGATLPFGMAKPVADVRSDEKMAGFASDDSAVWGFSALHDSGTGGSASMGNFPIFVYPSCPNLSECRLQKTFRGSHYKKESVQATPGYFSIELENGVKSEMAASMKVALFKFSFANGTDTTDMTILQEGSDLPGSQGTRALYIDPVKQRFTAEGRFNPSFGQGHYRAYTCVDVKGAKVQDVGGFNSSAVLPDQSYMNDTSLYFGPKQGVYARFENVKATDTIWVRYGLSWLSIERACENAENEVGDWNFERLRRESEKAWRKKLAPIKIDSKGVDKKHLRNYWSGVYRAFLSPQDYTGENQLWNSTEPYYDSWYCIWDTFRGVHPFYMLVDTISQSRMVRSLIDTQKHLGWLPDCRMSFCKGLTQGGSNADVVIVDSFVKKLEGVNWDDAYAAIVKDAEEEPANWDVEGRGSLDSWKTIGYVPFKEKYDPLHEGLRTRSISRTVEYAYDDFCIASMANATGRHEDYEKYTLRAGNWKNVYNPDIESMGFKGFPQPRWKNGTFGFQNATLCSDLNNFHGCYLNPSGHETYEGSPWTYLFFVPGDMQGLITLLGGREAFLARLEKLHDSGVLYMGDEQAFLTAFLYHYAGRPGLSAKRTHMYIPDMFNDTITGIPGNDDSGAMGTFVFFSMLGVFPSAGQNVYFIIPPYFPSVSIKNPQTGKTATIRNVNFDPTYEKMYVQSAKLNGRTYTKNWIDHEFFLNGGTLDLVLGDVESEWGTREEDCPPSLSTGLHLP